MIDYFYLIKDFIDCKGDIREWINRRYKNDQSLILRIDEIEKYSKFFDYVMTRNGVKYKYSEFLPMIYQASTDYHFEDIRENDRVVDIGACVGGFSIPASNFSKYVTAIEPLFIPQLKENIALNNKKIEIVEGALGDGSIITIKFSPYGSFKVIEKSIRTMPFTEIIEISGGIDFLKCDCEGAEWYIEPESLRNIRRIEMEIHQENPSANNQDKLMEYIFKNYRVNIERAFGDREWPRIIHACRK